MSNKTFVYSFVILLSIYTTPCFATKTTKTDPTGDKKSDIETSKGGENSSKTTKKKVKESDKKELPKSEKQKKAPAYSTKSHNSSDKTEKKQPSSTNKNKRKDKEKRSGVSTAKNEKPATEAEEEEESISVTPTSTKIIKKKVNKRHNSKRGKNSTDKSIGKTLKTSNSSKETEEGFVVTATKTKRKIKDVPIKTEVIGKKKIEAKGATNLLEALDNEVGIVIDNSCSICNTASIRLSGLPGRYTLFMVDGMPLYSSLGSTYGLVGIPAALIERIEIVKGASSVLYGTDAIGGIVNVITKKPGKKFTSIDFRIGSHNEYNLSLVSSTKKAGVFGPETFMGMIVFGSNVSSDSRDRDNDGITESAGYERSMIGTNIYIHPLSFMDIMIRSTVLQAKRQGGAKGAFLEVINGWDPVALNGLRALSESILTRRVENGMIIRMFGKKTTADLTLAHVYHFQDSDYEGEYYKATQQMLYASPSVHMVLGKYYSIIFGGSYRQENLKENVAVSEYTYRVGGIFAEGNFHIKKKFEIVHGVRFDHHNTYGSAFTPRLALKYAPHRDVTLRGGVGSAFRAPTTFYEYNHGIHPAGYSIQMDTTGVEKSKGANLSVNYTGIKGLNFTIESAYNIIDNAVALESLNNGSVLRVFNVDSPLEVISLEAQLQGKISRYFSFSLGYGEYHYKDEAGVLMTAPPKRQFTGAFSLKIKGFTANLSGKLMAPMDLTKVYGHAYNPLANSSFDDLLDPSTGADLNSPKLEKSPWWGTVNLQVSYSIKKRVQIYFGINNMLDFHQNDKESPLMFPSVGGPGTAAMPLDVTYIWGPLEGRSFYGGIKLKL